MCMYTQPVYTNARSGWVSVTMERETRWLKLIHSTHCPNMRIMTDWVLAMHICGGGPVLQADVYNSATSLPSFPLEDLLLDQYAYTHA